FGVKAYVTGCLTLTAPRRAQEPNVDKTYFVYGSGEGALPSTLLHHAPSEALQKVEFVFNRMRIGSVPLTSDQRRLADLRSAEILSTLSRQASLVVTPLHHVAAPCIAMGIPTIICR